MQKTFSRRARAVQAMRSPARRGNGPEPIKRCSFEFDHPLGARWPPSDRALARNHFADSTDHANGPAHNCLGDELVPSLPSRERRRSSHSNHELPSVARRSSQHSDRAFARPAIGWLFWDVTRRPVDPRDNHLETDLGGRSGRGHSRDERCEAHDLRERQWPTSTTYGPRDARRGAAGGGELQS